VREVLGPYSRRQVLAAGAACVVLGPAIAATSCGSAAEGLGDVVGPGEVDVTLRVNGASREVRVEPRVTLLDALRERLDATGTKKGCDHGECGACTVLINGRRSKSCLTLAVMQHGAEITTIEGLARREQLHPLQEAFIRNDGFQCGFCTSGQIMSAAGLLGEAGRTVLSDAEIREGMSGNLCRCSCYPQIVAAIREAQRAQGVAG
jgi:xanthine dehydrogenase YagT iron-sulfur-binding subunit